VLGLYGRPAGGAGPRQSRAGDGLSVCLGEGRWRVRSALCRVTATAAVGVPPWF